MVRWMAAALLLGILTGCGDGWNLGGSIINPTPPPEKTSKCSVDSDCLSNDCNDATGVCR